MNAKPRRTLILPVLCAAPVFLFGLWIMCYPLVSNLMNQKSQARVIGDYSAAVESMGKDGSHGLLRAAWDYNAAHTVNHISGKFPTGEAANAYAQQLSVNGDVIMGCLEIKKIGVSLAIYHGTDKAVLSVGIGHLPRTSLPVGGPSSHAVLSGHTGLPSAELLTKLDQLEIGDRFLIHVLDETRTYEVDQIKVVLPNEMGKHLAIVPGEDYITLLTCTPKGVNTHRLLVRGKAISSANAHIRLLQEALRIFPWPIVLLLWFPMVLAVALYIRLAYRREKKRVLLAARVSRFRFFSIMR